LTSWIRRVAVRPSTEVATTWSMCLPGVTRAAFHKKTKGARRSAATRRPSTLTIIRAAFAPHGRTRSFTAPRTFVHGRAPALVSANALLSTNRQAAQELFLSEHTVNFHMKNILHKLHVRNRAQAVAYAVRTGLVEPAEGG